MDELATFAVDKNPSVKQQTLHFISRSLRTTTSPPTKTDLGALTPLLLKSLEDSAEPVRAAAAEALGTLVKCVGERALGGAVDGLDDGRKAKVREQAELAVVKVRPGTGAPATKPPPAAAAPAKPKPVRRSPRVWKGAVLMSVVGRTEARGREQREREPDARRVARAHGESSACAAHGASCFPSHIC